jgi:hypothetical protein
VKLPESGRFLIVFIKNTNLPRRYFGFVFLMANTIGCYLEYNRQNYMLLTLDAMIAVICMSMIAATFLNSRLRSTILYLILLWVGIFLEVETQLHDPLGSYDDPDIAWAPYLVLMVSILIFPFRPVWFISYWSSIFIYSIIRYSFHDPFNIVIQKLLVFSTSAVPAVIFFFMLYHWWFRLNLNSYKQKEKIASLRNRLIEEERKNIYRDMHNYMGADLTHLLIGIDRVPASEGFSERQKAQLRRNALALIASLQQGISRGKDLEILKQKGVEGIKEILIRRYSYSGRSVRFKTGKHDQTSILKSKLFLDLITEITNNDLKYGFDDSVWFFCKDDDLILQFTSKTDYNSSGGNGKILLREIAEKMYLDIQEEIEGGFYKLTLQKNKIPFHPGD